MPAPTQAELQTRIEKLYTNLGRIDQIVNGSVSTIVTVDNGLQIPSMKRLQSLIADGNDGWSPSFALVTDGERLVLQISSWTGGEGTAPASGQYLGPTGLTSTIDDAVDISGDDGAHALVTHRPGDRTDLFTENVGGLDYNDLVPISASLATVSDAGLVVRVVGPKVIRSRIYFPVETGRVYKTRFAIQRRVNSSDPSNDTVQVGVIWYDQAKQYTGQITALNNYTNLLVANGRQELSGLFSIAGGVGVNTVPSLMRYASPFAQTFGVNPVTDIEILEWTDVTDADLYSPDLTTVNARLSAVESWDAGARTTVLEAALTGPKINSYHARAAAIAATLPVSTEMIRLYGETLPGDIPLKVFRRFAGAAPAGSDTFNSADGALWLSMPFSMLANRRIVVTAAKTVSTYDNGGTLACSGGFYAVTFAAGSNYQADHQQLVVNENTTAAIKIILTAGETFFLWPGQAVYIFLQNNIWRKTPEHQRFNVGGRIIRVDPDTGDDLLNDGLSTGAGRALKSLNGASDYLQRYGDWRALQVTIQGTPGTSDNIAFHSSWPQYLGGGGSAAILIDGAGMDFTGPSFQLFYAQLTVKQLNMKSPSGVGAFHGAKLYFRDGMGFFGVHGFADIQIINALVQCQNHFLVGGTNRTHFINNDGGRFEALAVTGIIDANQSVSNWVIGTNPGMTNISQITWDTQGLYSVATVNKVSLGYGHVLHGVGTLAGMTGNAPPAGVGAGAQYS